jgi:hypothetical protein
MRKRVRWVAVAVALALAFVAIRSISPEGSSAARADRLGFALGGAIDGERPATAVRELRAATAAGAGWVRLDVNWAVIQRNGPRRYDWRGTDRLVGAAIQRGLRVLSVIVYTPRWARPAGTDASWSPPARAYAAFARRVAARYRTAGVHAYEVWNEPNLSSFWRPAADPAAYAAVVKAAGKAIHAADRKATVVTGGLSPAASGDRDVAPVEFLQRVYAAGAGGAFDAVGHHPYCFPGFPGGTEPWNAWYQMYGTEPSLRSVMAANGDAGKKIWATEFGAPTGGPSDQFVDEWEQSDMVARAAALWQGYGWAGPLFVYALRDLGTGRSTRENFFGLLRRDFSEKPAYRAFQDAAAAAS